VPRSWSAGNSIATGVHGPQAAGHVCARLQASETGVGMGRSAYDVRGRRGQQGIERVGNSQPRREELNDEARRPPEPSSVCRSIARSASSFNRRHSRGGRSPCRAIRLRSGGSRNFSAPSSFLIRSIGSPRQAQRFPCLGVKLPALSARRQSLVEITFSLV
jgi:hypothetical protein